VTLYEKLRESLRRWLEGPMYPRVDVHANRPPPAPAEPVQRIVTPLPPNVVLLSSRRRSGT
jgi:hypothetical protein